LELGGLLVHKNLKKKKFIQFLLKLTFYPSKIFFLILSTHKILILPLHSMIVISYHNNKLN
jgi:hypothetical protein